MAGNYAIKPILVIDFIDVEDFAIVRPFRDLSPGHLNSKYSVTYRQTQKLASSTMCISLQLPKEIMWNKRQNIGTL